MIKSIKQLSFEGNSAAESQVHFLPCKIHYNGKANINDFFKPTTVKENDEELNVSFRGYPLNGKVIEVPKGYQGLILKEESAENLVPEKAFRKLTYWEWDKTPSKNDAFLSAFDWFTLSSSVHDPVEDPEH